jgi:pyrroline-5-carboxylate reductase
MTNRRIGFIGAGRVARILLAGWARVQAMPAVVVLYDTNPAACETLKSSYSGIDVSADAAGAAAQDVVFLAVHPPAMAEAAAAIRGALRPDAVLVSLAPKFTIEKLSGLLGGFHRIARVIPNAPSVVGRGYNPVAFGPALNPDDKARIGGLLSPLGDYPEVNEPSLEAYAILAAMGPTYFWPQLYALAALGESFGLNRDDALAALDKMLWGTVATLKESGLSPEQVQDLIPVKPVAEEVATLVSAYQAKLAGLMEKIKP